MVWPANIDSAKTTGEGRKVRKEACVTSPKLQEMSAAAANLGMKFEIITGSSRPIFWWDKTGHLLVEKSGMSKRALLVSLAEQIRRLRATKP